jgi:hypothetical protein
MRLAVQDLRRETFYVRQGSSAQLYETRRTVVRFPSTSRATGIFLKDARLMRVFCLCVLETIASLSEAQ